MNAADPAAHFAASGLNLVAVFDLADLPPALQERIAATVPDVHRFRQLLLIGNAGTGFWQNVRAQEGAHEHLVDHWTVQCVDGFFEGRCDYRILYPGDHALPLQQLGRIAGWHHDSPLGLGIHPSFGLWYAYRAVVLSDSAITPTRPVAGASRCAACTAKPCIAACPAGAVRSEGFVVAHCSRFRLAANSACAETCLARLACPVAAEHRYSDDQMAYHYGFSLAAMRRWQRG